MAKIKKELEEKIRRAAKNRCGYCLNPQELMPYKLEIEHLIPKAADCIEFNNTTIVNFGNSIIIYKGIT